MILVQGYFFTRYKPRFTLRVPKDTGEDECYYTCSECSVRLNRNQIFSSHLDKNNYHKDPEKCPSCDGTGGDLTCKLCYGGGWV